MLSTRVPEEAIVSDIQGAMVVVGGGYETRSNEEKSARWMPARMLKVGTQFQAASPSKQTLHSSIITIQNHQPILLLLNA
jgi:hypothetical protein